MLYQKVLSKVYLNKYGLYFKFTLLLSGDINLNLGPTTPKKVDMLWELLAFLNCRFSTERMDYQLDYLPDISNHAWNIFQKRDMHLISLNINSLLSKINKTGYIAKLINAIVIGLTKTKLDNAVLSSELEIEGYDLVRSDGYRRGGSVACSVKILFYIITSLMFALMQGIDFLPKSKSVLIGVL